MKWFSGTMLALFFLFGMYWFFAQYYKPKGHYHLKFITNTENEYFATKFENDTLYTLHEDGKDYHPYGWLLPFQRKLIISHCLEVEYAYFYVNDTLKLRYLDGETNSKINYIGWKPEKKNCSRLKHYLASSIVELDLQSINDSAGVNKINRFYKGIQIGIPRNQEKYGDSMRVAFDKSYWLEDDDIKLAHEALQLYNDKISERKNIFVYADKNVRIKDVKKYLIHTLNDELTSWNLIFQSKQNSDDFFLRGFRLENMNWEQINDNQLLTEYVLNQWKCANFHPH